MKRNGVSLASFSSRAETPLGSCGSARAHVLSFFSSAFLNDALDGSPAPSTPAESVSGVFLVDHCPGPLLCCRPLSPQSPLHIVCVIKTPFAAHWHRFHEYSSPSSHTLPIRFSWPLLKRGEEQKSERLFVPSSCRRFPLA